MADNVTPHPDFVRDALKRRGISKNELARRSGVHANSLAIVDSADWNPRWKTLEALCQAIKEIMDERA